MTTLFHSDPQGGWLFHALIFRGWCETSRMSRNAIVVCNNLHCHPDPFDFVQDKGQRRISPARGLLNFGADSSPLAFDDEKIPMRCLPTLYRS